MDNVSYLHIPGGITTGFQVVICTGGTLISGATVVSILSSNVNKGWSVTFKCVIRFVDFPISCRPGKNDEDIHR